MSDWMPDTPDMSVDYCPGCEPERDPFEVLPNGKVLSVRMCEKHKPAVDGSEDAIKTVSDAYLPSSGMAESEVSNRAACDILHRPPSKRRKKNA